MYIPWIYSGILFIIICFLWVGPCGVGLRVWDIPTGASTPIVHICPILFRSFKFSIQVVFPFRSTLLENSYFKGPNIEIRPLRSDEHQIVDTLNPKSQHKISKSGWPKMASLHNQEIPKQAHFLIWLWFQIICAWLEMWLRWFDCQSNHQTNYKMCEWFVIVESAPMKSSN